MIVDIKHHNHTAVKSRAQDRAARLHWDQCIEIDLWVIESHDDHGAHQEVDNLRSRLCVIIIISLLFLVNCFGLPKLLFDLSIWYIYIYASEPNLTESMFTKVEFIWQEARHVTDNRKWCPTSEQFYLFGSVGLREEDMRYDMMCRYWHDTGHQ